MRKRIVLALNTELYNQALEEGVDRDRLQAMRFLWKRGFPFEAWLKEENGKMTWQIQEIEDVNLNSLISLYKGGLKQRDIAQELRLGLGTVNRWINRAKEEGKIV